MTATAKCDQVERIDIRFDIIDVVYRKSLFSLAVYLSTDGASVPVSLADFSSDARPSGRIGIVAASAVPPMMIWSRDGSSRASQAAILLVGTRGYYRKRLFALLTD